MYCLTKTPLGLQIYEKVFKTDNTHWGIAKMNKKSKTSVRFIVEANI